MAYTPANFLPQSATIVLTLKDRNSKTLNQTFYMNFTPFDTPGGEIKSYLDQAWTQAKNKADSLAQLISSVTVLTVSSIEYTISDVNIVDGGIGDINKSGVLVWLTSDYKVATLTIPDVVSSAVAEDASGIDESAQVVTALSSYLITNQIRLTSSSTATLRMLMTEATTE
jgi:hypothetical protein